MHTESFDCRFAEVVGDDFGEIVDNRCNAIKSR